MLATELIILIFILEWVGALNGSEKNFKNPFGYLYDGFNSRPDSIEDQGGQFQPERYFSGEKVSPLFGISHVIKKRLILKLNMIQH